MNDIINFFLNLSSEQIWDLIIAIIIIVACNVLSPLFSYLIIKLFNFKKSKKKIKQNAFYRPLKSFFKVSAIYIALLYLRPVVNYSDYIMNIITEAYKIIVILTTAIGLANGIAESSHFTKKIQEKIDREEGDATVTFIIRAIKVLIYLVAGFLIFKELGYDLSGLITGLGLGTIVVTVAAQDTIKNLFGGFIIFLDKPFQVGDYIKFGDYEGTVEDINFRSTKIRTLDHSIAQVPNSDITGSTIINMSKIEKRRFSLDLGIVLNTNLEKMQALEAQILSFLNNCESIIPDSANVFFKEIRSNDFCLTIYCYLNIIDYGEFMKEKERINYAIMKIIKENHIELAYDTQTIEIKRT